MWHTVKSLHGDDGSNVLCSKERAYPTKLNVCGMSRGVDQVLDDEELGQLGVLEHQTDSAKDIHDQQTSPKFGLTWFWWSVSPHAVATR